MIVQCTAENLYYFIWNYLFEMRLENKLLCSLYRYTMNDILSGFIYNSEINESNRSDSFIQ